MFCPWSLLIGKPVGKMLRTGCLSSETTRVHYQFLLRIKEAHSYDFLSVANLPFAITTSIKQGNIRLETSQFFMV